METTNLVIIFAFVWRLGEGRVNNILKMYTNLSENRLKFYYEDHSINNVLKPNCCFD
jgi:hypothetical protein